MNCYTLPRHESVHEWARAAGAVDQDYNPASAHFRLFAVFHGSYGVCRLLSEQEGLILN